MLKHSVIGILITDIFSTHWNKLPLFSSILTKLLRGDIKNGIKHWIGSKSKEACECLLLYQFLRISSQAYTSQSLLSFGGTDLFFPPKNPLKYPNASGTYCRLLSVSIMHLKRRRLKDGRLWVDIRCPPTIGIPQVSNK